eukprot:scaffold3416_cov76-Cyclotella_meneghiniana.AAC.6
MVSSLSSHPKRSLTNLLLLSLLQLTTKSNALVLYDDGSSHSVTDNINDAVNLRSSSALDFSGDHHTIRAPKGSESAVRLYMSSTLNMTTGEIIGGDLDDDNSDGSSSSVEEKHSLVGAGVIVGSASIAEFHKGATVRGGSHVSVGDELIASDGRIPYVVEEVTTDLQSNSKGGDSLIGLYFGSSIIIHGGNFIAGRGSSSYGHSLHLAYEAQANVYGGSFQGSFLARDRGVIVVHGCLSRVGNRLVGHLENGDSVDLELVEQNGGKVVVETPKFDETGTTIWGCNRYHRTSSGGKIGVGTFVGTASIIGLLSYYF